MPGESILSKPKNGGIVQPEVTQEFLNKLPEPTDMPSGLPWVQWRVENTDEFERFLEDFEVRMKRIPGDQLLIQGAWSHWSIQLSPGDCLVLWPASAERPREQLGVIRVPESARFREGTPERYT